MPSERNLRKIAKLVYRMCGDAVWTGGVACESDIFNIDQNSYEQGWPDALWLPQFIRGAYWSLSPEVTVGNTALRVCIVSSNRCYGHDGLRERYIRENTVMVFVGNDLKYPGGKYDAGETAWWWPFNGGNWAVHIARQIRIDGGRTGQVAGTRDRLLTQCKQQAAGKPVLLPPEEDPLYAEAFAELDRELAGRAGLQTQSLIQAFEESP